MDQGNALLLAAGESGGHGVTQVLQAKKTQTSPTHSIVNERIFSL
jgi:hypothetical protein